MREMSAKKGQGPAWWGARRHRAAGAELREKWPLAFPVNDQDVRPLAIEAPGEIAAVAKNNGSVAARHNLRTAGPPAKILLSAARRTVALPPQVGGAVPR